MLALVQAALWVEGHSVHDREMDRHVPDYSCCRPELLAHREERELFLLSLMTQDTRAVERLMLMFMARMLAGANPTRNTGAEPSKK